MLSNSCATKPMSGPAAKPSAGAAVVNDLLGRELNFPAGLLGFPDCQRFELSHFEAGAGNPSPFFVLSSRDRELTCVVLHPDWITRDYCVPLSAELLGRLGVDSGRQVLPLLIVTVRERVEEITVNLQGPLAIGIDTAVGVQLVVEEYPLRYPLIVK